MKPRNNEKWRPFPMATGGGIRQAEERRTSARRPPRFVEAGVRFHRRDLFAANEVFGTGVRQKEVPVKMMLGLCPC